MENLKYKKMQLHPEGIEVDDLGGQSRVAGIDSNHVKELIPSLRAHGQMHPILVEQFGDTFTCIGGHHRIMAQRKINDVDEKQTKLDAKVYSGLTSAERKKLQLWDNNHLPAKASTKDDLTHVYAQLVRMEGACGDLSLFESDKQRIAEVKRLIMQVTPGEARAGQIAKQVFRELPNISGFKKLKNYTKACAIKAFNDFNGNGFTVKKSAVPVGNEVFYFSGEESLLSAQWSLAQTKMSKSPNCNINVVTWLKNPEGKTPSDVRAWREKVVKLCKERNSWVESGPLGKVYQKVWFLPQILQCSEGVDSANSIKAVSI